MNMPSHAGSDQVTTRIVRSVDDALLKALGWMVPQLSATSAGTLVAPGRWELDQLIAEPDAILIVAEFEAEIVGMLSVVLFRTPTGLHAKIEDLVVDEYGPARGVAERLVRRALTTATGRGATIIEATCPSASDGGKVYERLGFEQRSTNAFVYRLSG